MRILFTHTIFFACLFHFSCQANCQEASKSVESEKESLEKMRPFATNIQFHKDGTVQLVRVSKPHVKDADLVHLRSFSQIEYVAIVSSAVSDEGFSHIAELKNLDTLVLNQTGISNNGLKHLAALTKLERLYLEDTAIDDGAFEHLAKLKNLKVLSLRRTRITDDAMKQIAQLAQLEALFLCGTDITDHSIPFVVKLEQLKTLYLANTKLSGNDLAQLANLKHLEYLAISGTKIDDKAIANLKESKSLKQIVALETNVTELAVAEIQRQTSSIAIRISKPSKPANLDLIGRVEVKQHDSNLETIASAKTRFTESLNKESPDFQKHVIPLFGRLGCNARSCHGSFQGQGGFRLSMFGYDFASDHTALTGGDDSRVDSSKPASSLILNKPTSDDDHEGGLRFEKEGWEYQLLYRWIAAGAKGQTDDHATFVRLEVTPSEIVFEKAGQEDSLNVVAVWSDGTHEDVTCLTRFQSNDEAVASVTENGLVQATGTGDTHVIAFYDNGIVDIPVMLPVSKLTGDEYPDVPVPTRIDELVVSKLRKVGIVPSELCSDEEFLRRVSIDLIGTLPTPEEITKFVADNSSDKRSRKIDELLEHPAYTAWWTTRLCDLTGSNAGYLGNTEMAQPVAEQWRAWIERRVKENVGWDQIVKGIVLATSRRPGQSYESYIAEQSRFTSKQNAADFAALDNPMPHYWYRSNQTMPADKALTFGYTFLGVRLQCAQCHKHPYDQWSNEDFEQFTNFFKRIKAGVAPDAVEPHRRTQEMLAVPGRLNTAALRRQSYLRVAAEGRPIPWGEIYIESPRTDKPFVAKLLGSQQFDLNEFEDPRQPIMQWMLQKDNPYFAKAFVNRIWANYFNVGIVEPVDDLNMANPPSNRALLDYLSNEFVDRGYDIKWLHREIVSSRTYQLSWQPNETNRRDERNFSHAIIRRMPAEIVIDALLQSTGNQSVLEKSATEVANRKIGQHPKSYQTRAIDYSLLIFGKPLRTTNCDCERKNSPTLLQALYLRNDEDTLAALTRNDGWLAEVEKEMIKQPDLKVNEIQKNAMVDSLVELAYLRTLSRQPTDSESADCRQHILESSSIIEGLQDVMWALLNTQEFVTNH